MDHDDLAEGLAVVIAGDAVDETLAPRGGGRGSGYWLALVALCVCIGVAILSTGCAALGAAGPAIAAGVAQGAQWLGSLLDVASAGSDAFFARHPSQEAEARIKALLAAAHQALAALNHVIVSGGDATAARQEALDAYSALRAAVYELGLPTATPPEGGAETDAPLPQPFSLPRRAEVAGALEGGGGG